MTRKQDVRKIRMMDLLVAARRYTNAKDSQIISALRGHLGTPLVDDNRYFTKTAAVKAEIERWTQISEDLDRGKANLACFKDNLDEHFSSPVRPA